MTQIGMPNTAKDDNPMTNDLTLSQYESFLLSLQKQHYPTNNADVRLMALVCGFAEETGEVMGILKRHYRGDGVECVPEALIGELGDVLAYLTLIAAAHNLTLADVAQYNMDKLYSRSLRGTSLGKGSER